MYVHGTALYAGKLLYLQQPILIDRYEEHAFRGGRFFRYIKTMYLHLPQKETPSSMKRFRSSIDTFRRSLPCMQACRALLHPYGSMRSALALLPLEVGGVCVVARSIDTYFAEQFRKLSCPASKPAKTGVSENIQAFYMYSKNAVVSLFCRKWIDYTHQNASTIYVQLSRFSFRTQCTLPPRHQVE